MGVKAPLKRTINTIFIKKMFKKLMTNYLVTERVVLNLSNNFFQMRVTFVTIFILFTKWVSLNLSDNFFRCEICSKQLKTFASLGLHMKRIHSEEKEAQVGNFHH